MNITVEPRPIGGRITAIPSKSHVHRLLISAALSGEETRVICPASSEDIGATARCLNALCADISYDGESFTVRPDRAKALSGRRVLDCGESGSTYRFLFPVQSPTASSTVPPYPSIPVTTQSTRKLTPA